MLVIGGRFGWTRAVWSGALVLGVAALVGTAACGSRTSMLDPDAYGTIDGEGGTSSSPIGHAGKTSSGSAGHPSGTGGTTLLPIAGTGSGASGSVDSRASVTCQQYCPGYGTQCAKRLKGRECLPTCQGELTTFGPVCEDMGINALQCLTPFFSPRGGNCDDAVNRALTQCGKVVQAFEDCKKQFSSGTTPPGGLPVGGVASCPRSSGPIPGGNCTEVFACNNGPYVTSCNISPQTMLLDCSCVSPSGNAPTARLPFTSDPCLAATALCR